MKVKIAFPKNLYFGIMTKYTFPVWFVLFMVSCKEAPVERVETTQNTNSFSIQDYPKGIVLEPQVLDSTRSWSEFVAMEGSFDILKRATSTEDLKLAIDDLIEKEKALAKAKSPESFDKLQIKSRQQLFRTFLYKVKANLIDARPVNEGMTELINAYNAYKNQFNVISGSTLDAKLILDEE
ncbi:MAG: hypothetical protein ACFB0A_15130 [Croceivirga sp.]